MGSPPPCTCDGSITVLRVVLEVLVEVDDVVGEVVDGVLGDNVEIGGLLITGGLRRLVVLGDVVVGRVGFDGVEVVVVVVVLGDGVDVVVEVVVVLGVVDGVVLVVVVVLVVCVVDGVVRLVVVVDGVVGVVVEVVESVVGLDLGGIRRSQLAPVHPSKQMSHSLPAKFPSQVHRPLRIKTRLKVHEIFPKIKKS